MRWRAEAGAGAGSGAGARVVARTVLAVGVCGARVGGELQQLVERPRVDAAPLSRHDPAAPRDCRPGAGAAVPARAALSGSNARGGQDSRSATKAATKLAASPALADRPRRASGD